MNSLDFELKFTTVEKSIKGVPAIIVAAGNSSRMKGIDKQFVSLLGIPVLARTLLAFEKSQCISEIFVVTQKEKQEDIKLLAEKYMISKLAGIVEGGSSREESVKNGLNGLPKGTTKALVHDGARPLVSQKVISDVALALENNDCVSCAVKTKDTIKRVNSEGLSVETISREGLVNIQTPQGVNVSLFLKATEKADLKSFTDDTSVMESIGIKTKIVDGDYKNIKVTTTEDISLAAIYLEGEM